MSGTAKLKIALVVHGRFHAFDVAPELLRLGHDLTLFTNYPASVAERFGVPARRVRSFLAHGLGTRAARRLSPPALAGIVERFSHTAFSRWAARQVRRERWDVVHAWSGVGEELFRAARPVARLLVLERGNSHIAVQRRLLADEEARAGAWVEKPTDWIVARERREYALADRVHVLGGFSYRSFLEEGFPAERLVRIELGFDTKTFRATAEVREARRARLSAGAPLRVLNVGTFCLRKGALDFAAAIRRLDPGRFEFRFVGPVAADAARVAAQLAGRAEFAGPRPQAALPREYAWGDLFVLPTVEDGSPVVLNQAVASGLPLVTTPHCHGPELIGAAGAGWVVPIRRPDLLAERLAWCDAHRGDVAAAAEASYESWANRDWSDAARQIQEAYWSALGGCRRPGRVANV